MEEISLQRVVDVLIKNILNIILVGVIGICVGILYSCFIMDKEYKAISMVTIPKSQLIEEYSKVVKNDSVLSSIAEKYGLTIQSLKDSVSIDLTSKKTYDIKIAVTNASSELAANISNDVSKKFVNELKINYEVKNAKVSQEAVVPTTYYNYTLKIVIKKVLKIFVIFEIMYLGIILVIEFFSCKIKTEEYLKNNLKYNKIIGNISTDETKKMFKGNPTYYSLQCKNLVNRIRHIYEEDNGKMLLLMVNAAESKQDFNNILDAFVKTDKKILLLYLNSSEDSHFKIDFKYRAKNLVVSQVSGKYKLQTKIEENKEKYDYILVVSHQLDGLNVQEDILELFKNILLFVKYGLTSISKLEEANKILDTYNKLDDVSCVTLSKSYIEEIKDYYKFVKNLDK